MTLLVEKPQSSPDYLLQADALAHDFALTAVERYQAGGTPKAERDRLRQSRLLKLIIRREYGGLGESWITNKRNATTAKLPKTTGFGAMASIPSIGGLG
jgi:alkylation response protein AidB-like acyl-CoA dehydrogenase